MKKLKFVLIVVAVVAILTLSFTACADSAGNVPVATPDSLADHNVAPTFTGYYATQFDDAMALDSDIDKAIALWAIGSYSEGQADQFVFFENKIGSAVGGTMYYQQINKRKPADDGNGSKYHYTLKKVVDGNAAAASLIQNTSRLRFVTHDRGYNGLYRFEKDGKLDFTGKKLFGHDIINMPWKKGGDFGKEEGIYKDYIVSENTNTLSDVLYDMETDIFTRSKDSKEEDKIKGNINVFEPNIISSATVEQKDGYVSVTMAVNVDVANASKESIAMLKKSTEASEITWSEMSITFDIWNGGLFKSYQVSDKWSGKVKGFSGDASPIDNVYYSYSDSDCSFEKELDFLDKFMESLNA